VAEFQEFERLEPFGAWRDNWHTATVAHILASVHTDPRKVRPKLSDFMYKDQETHSEEQIAAADAFFFRKGS
jgi:hypothetical protein